MNYKPFKRHSYNSPSLQDFELKESVDGSYSLVPVDHSKFDGVDARDFCISSQIKSGVSLSEVNKIQPLNRLSAADKAESIMNNVINSK